ncbi:MAG: MOSC domain-containing protein [Chloroflexota bacterium]
MKNNLSIVSVNIGKREPIRIGKETAETVINKQPTHGSVSVEKYGLADDVIADKEHHGGVDQAVYLYSLEDYAWWSTTLQADLSPGTFGENLTITGLDFASLRIGDRFQINDVLLEVTCGRIPCAKLAARMGDPAFVKRFAEAGRPGAYTRVLSTGTVQTNDQVSFIPTSENHPTVIELFEIWYAKDRDPALLRRGLAAPVAERARSAFEFWLGKKESHLS